MPNSFNLCWVKCPHCQLYNYVQCIKKYKPLKVVGKDVSLVERAVLKKVAKEKQPYN